jgi:putative ABC transport system substrate-binding protein
VFLNALQELGYIEGQSITLETRHAEGSLDRLPELAADLVRLKVSVIVAVSPLSIVAATKVTRTVPIVMINGGDPIARGFVQSWARPGGNVTGLSGTADGSHDKRLELLTEAFPGIARVAFLNTVNTRKQGGMVDIYARVATALHVHLETIDVRGPEEFESAFSRIASTRPDALLTMRDPLSLSHARKIVQFALKQRLPAIYETGDFVEAGGLMSYGPNHRAQWHRAAAYVDKILKGANPAVLPVEPPQLEFVINLATARALGVTIPPEILLEADRVIK